MFVHVLFTWLLAHLLHPLVLAVQIYLMDGGGSFAVDLMGFSLFIAGFGVIVSLPALLISWLVFSMIVQSGLPTQFNLVVWLLASSTIVMFTFVVVMRSYDLLERDLFPLVISPLVATCLSIIIRINQFLKISIRERDEQN